MTKELHAVSLKSGDTLGICAPSGIYDETLFQKGLQVLEEMGFNIYLPSGLSAEKRYLAGDDAHRAEILNRLIHDDAVQGILCARGGYGAMRILSMIDFQGLKKSPKPFVGYSDVTAILSVIGKASGVQVIHGPVVTSLGKNDRATRESLFQALTGVWDDIQLPRGRTLVPGKALGVLTGGNLATLVHLMGTPYQPNFNGCILFIEDICEPPYKIDRMLSQMAMASLFKGVRGVVMGTFEDCGTMEQIEDIVWEIFQEEGVPILAGLEAGHGITNLCLPLGRKMILDADAQCLILAHAGNV